MLDRLREIAPLVQWFEVLASAGLLLLGFVAYGHYRLLSRGFGETLGGVGGLFRARRVSSAARWTIVYLATGLALWGLAMGWSAAVVAVLLGLAAAFVIHDILIRLLRPIR